MKIEEKPEEWFKEDPENPRTVSGGQADNELSASMRTMGQLVPLIALVCGTIVDGHRRLRAARKAGLKTLKTVILEKRPTPGEKLEIQLATSISRQALSPYQLYAALTERLRLTPDLKLQDLAQRVGLDAGYQTKILSLGRCIPAVQEAARAGRLTVSAWYAISKADEPAQHEMLAALLSGEVKTREELDRKRRAPRNVGKVGPSKVTVRVGSKSVQVCGENLTISDVVELLAEVLKDARKAEATYDLKTWERMWRDRNPT